MISEWQLQLPANPSKGEPCQFDYDTISDAILHIRYTAREGGGLLRNGALANLAAQIEAANTIGSVRLFSIRHEFPTAWAKFVNTKIDGEVVKTAELRLDLLPEHYPYWSQDRRSAVKWADVIVKTVKRSIKITENADGSGKLVELQDASQKGLLTGKLGQLAPKSPVTAAEQPLKLYLDDNKMDDLWLAIAWGA